MKPRQFAYTPRPHFSEGMPYVDVRLSHQETAVSVSALVDSGAALNVLPLDIGMQLGLSWESQTFSLDLKGILSGVEAYAVLLQAEITPFPAVDMAFAWVNKPRPELRTLLGQVNFFREFDVHFYGHHQIFEICPNVSRLKS